MLIVAYRLLRQVRLKSVADKGMSLPKVRINPDSGKFIWTIPTAALLACIGGVTGFITGLLGVGGVGSTVLRHTVVPWDAAAVFTTTTVLGMLLGRRLIKKIAPNHLQVVFAVVLTLVALGLLLSASSELLV